MARGAAQNAEFSSFVDADPYRSIQTVDASRPPRLRVKHRAAAMAERIFRVCQSGDRPNAASAAANQCALEISEGSALLYLIDRRNRAAFHSQIEDMYRIRHRIYVDGRGWRAIARPDLREKDQFDTEDATYLLGLAPGGAVLSGVRLLPTKGPHLMRDVFAHIVTDGEIPAEDNVYEMTRYFVREDARGDARRHAVQEILCGILEFSLERGLKQISVVCDTFFVPRFQEGGWTVRPLGRETPYPEGTCIAVLLEVSRDCLSRARAAAGIDGASLTCSAFPPSDAARQDDAVAA